MVMTAISRDDQQHAQDLLSHLGAHVRVVAEDGSLFDLPDSAAEALTQALRAAADGEQTLVVRAADDLTTSQAAVVLGVSRPTVVRLIEKGTLDAHMVGTHRRLALRDVLEHRAASRERRQAALDDMVRAAEEAGLYDEEEAG
jgi:excisionase family DNA binding protein